MSAGGALHGRRVLRGPWRRWSRGVVVRVWGLGVEDGSVGVVLEAVPEHVPVPAAVVVLLMEAVVAVVDVVVGIEMCSSWRWQGSQDG